MDAPGYEAVADGGAAAGAARQSCRVRLARARPLAVAAVLALAALVATGGVGARRWGEGARPWPGRPEGLVQEREAAGPRCAEAEVGVDYWTATNLAVLENVSTSEGCLQRCTDEARCGAWTWGEPDGTPEAWQLQRVCFLKPTGLSVDKHPMDGVVSGLPCRSEQGEEVAREGVFQAIQDCHHTEEGVDLLGSALGSLALPPVDGVPSAGACRAACEGEPRCGAWTWGKARNTRWLTDVCFLKEASNLGQLFRLNKTGVVSGFPCRGPQASPTAPSAASGGVEGHDVEVLSDCREEDPNIDYWTMENVRVLEGVADSAACSDTCQAEPACGAWTWGSPTCPKELHRGRCYLKGLAPRPQRVREDGLVSGVPCRPTAPAEQLRRGPAEGSAAAPASSPEPPGAKEKVQHRHPEECHDPEVDVDYMAKDLSSEPGVGSAEDCRKRCEQAARCDFWTWGKVRGWVGLSDVCFFKSATPGVVAQRYQKYGVVSGAPCRSTPPGPAEAADRAAPAHATAAAAEEAPCLPSETDVDYVSKENLAERTGVKDAEACRTSCEREPRCGAWTWGTEDGPSAMVQICFLKPQDPETWRYPQAGVVSGRPCRSIQASPALDARQLRR